MYPRHEQRWLAGLSAVLLGLASLGAFGFAGTTKVPDRPSARIESGPGAIKPAGTEMSLPEVARLLRLPVVNIRSTFKATPASGIQLPQEFFGGRFRGFQMPTPPQESQPREGVGSGVIVSNDGIILTNNHVVKQAETVLVKLFNDREYEAKVLGTDPQSDLAVLKIQSSDLQGARLGDSDRVEVAETVLAMGSPFGLSQTVTSGIISATGRDQIGIADYEDFIQTDADINPGNSGGPLVNARGEVIGINTAIFSRSGGSMGIGFAIPINMARQIMQSLIEHGEVVRGFLGVHIQNLSAGLAQSFQLEGTEGALISDVSHGSPAEAAGLKSGDVIRSIDGEEIHNTTHLRNLIASKQPDTKVTLGVSRDGQSLDISVTLGRLESDRGAEASEASGWSLGLELSPLTGELSNRLGAEGLQGVVVSGVEPGSAAERAGLRSGDVILEVGSQPVRGPAELRRALGNLGPHGGLRLTVFSEGLKRFVFLERGS